MTGCIGLRLNILQVQHYAAQSRQSTARDLDRGVWVRRDERALATARHAWLFDLLFTCQDRPDLVAWSAAGQLPPGFQRAEQFAVLAAGPDRGFAVSLRSRRGAAAAMTAYNALRPPRRRIARGALGAGLRAGLAQPVLRTRIDIGTAPGATARQLADSALVWHVAELIGCQQPVSVAFGCGGGPYRKPVLQVFSTKGAPLCYVKVGWNDWTRDAVRREAEALRACAASSSRLGTPTLLHCARWRELELLVTAPLPRRVRRIGPAWPADTGLIREICALSPSRVSPLAASSWWARLLGRIEAGVTDPSSAGQLAAIADRTATAVGHLQLEFGRWHGDLVPWNLARHGNRLYAWDWESSAAEAPVGFDSLHYYFQVAFVARQVPLPDAVAFAAREAGPALSALRISADARRVLPALHLLELAVRHEEARASTGDRDERFYPAVLGTLDAELRAAAPEPSSERAA